MRLLLLFWGVFGGSNLQIISFANQHDCYKGERLFTESLLLNSGWMIIPGTEVDACEIATSQPNCEDHNNIWCGDCSPDVLSEKNTSDCKKCKEKDCTGPGACLFTAATPPQCLYQQINSESWSLFNFTNEESTPTSMCSSNPVGSTRTFKYNICVKYPWIDEGIFPYIIYKRVDTKCTIVSEQYYDSKNCTGDHKDAKIGFGPDKCVVTSAINVGDDDPSWEIEARIFSMPSPFSVALDTYVDPLCAKESTDETTYYDLDKCVGDEESGTSVRFVLEAADGDCQHSSST